MIASCPLQSARETAPTVDLQVQVDEARYLLRDSLSIAKGCVFQWHVAPQQNPMCRRALAGTYRRSFHLQPLQSLHARPGPPLPEEAQAALIPHTTKKKLRTSSASCLALAFWALDFLFSQWLRQSSLRQFAVGVGRSPPSCLLNYRQSPLPLSIPPLLRPRTEWMCLVRLPRQLRSPSWLRAIPDKPRPTPPFPSIMLQRQYRMVVGRPTKPGARFRRVLEAVVHPPAR